MRTADIGRGKIFASGNLNLVKTDRDKKNKTYGNHADKTQEKPEKVLS